MIRRSARIIGAPKVRLGTKCPSITSTWSHSAPPASVASTCSRSRPRSALSTLGAMIAFTGSSPGQVHAATCGHPDAGAGSLIEHGAVADTGPLGVPHVADAQSHGHEPVGRLLAGQALQRRHLNIGGAPAHDQRHRVPGPSHHAEPGAAGQDGAGRAERRDGVDSLEPEAGLEHHGLGQVDLEIGDIGHGHRIGTGADRKMDHRRRGEPGLRWRILPDHDPAPWPSGWRLSSSRRTRNPAAWRVGFRRGERLPDAPAAPACCLGDRRGEDPAARRSGTRTARQPSTSPDSVQDGTDGENAGRVLRSVTAKSHAVRRSRAA